MFGTLEQFIYCNGASNFFFLIRDVWSFLVIHFSLFMVVSKLFLKKRIQTNFVKKRTSEGNLRRRGLLFRN
jgi:hypothetical protein